jgi:membrane protease YdiL (CAAX protease family)
MAAPPPLLQPASAADRLGPRDRDEAFRWLLIAVLGVILGYAISELLTSASASLAGVRGGASALAAESVPPVWFIAVGFVGLWIGFGGSAFVATRSGRTVGLRLGQHDIWFLFLGVALQVALTFAYSFSHASGLSKPDNYLLGGGAGWGLLIPAVLSVVLAPLFEELFFRGVLLRALLVVCRTTLAWVGVLASVLIDATIFGFAHLGTDEWIQLPGLALVGAVLCVLAIKTRRLGPSIVTHASFNAAAVLWFAWTR